MWTAHNLERAADRVTNYVERVVYIVTGKARSRSGIPRTIEKVLNATSSHAPASIQDVLAADEAARECARGVIARHAASGLPRLTLKVTYRRQLLAEAIFRIGLLASMSTVLELLVVLGLMVLVHESGHFAVAKWCGVRVETFAIGFGKRVRRLPPRRHGYQINALPLGGYVKMAGEIPGEEVTNDPGELNNHPAGSAC